MSQNARPSQMCKTLCGSLNDDTTDNLQDKKMGSGIYLLFIIILLPLTALLTGLSLIAWLLTKQKVYGRIIGIMWGGIFGLIMLLVVINWLTSKTELEQKDYYGQYIVNRDYFQGIQSDWQYDHFRFEIKKNDSIYFHVTEKEKILKTYSGTIKTTDISEHNSARLIINMGQPSHHILTSNPTTHRSAWSFNLVFYSPKFNNVYFKKGQWKPLDK